MSHSHLAIRHLVKKLEMTDNRKPVRPIPPGWVVRFIEELSEQFEPFSGVARVGFECFEGETGWEVALFLGENELVGGAGDGELRPVNFRFNLLNLSSHFDSVETFIWNAFPHRPDAGEDNADLSVLTIAGTVSGQTMKIQIHAAPPEWVGPGIREHLDGRLELV